MCGKVLLISAVLVGLVSLSSCRTLGEWGLPNSHTWVRRRLQTNTNTDANLRRYTNANLRHHTNANLRRHTDAYLRCYTDTILWHYAKHPNYWKGHPDAIIAAIGSLGNIGQTFGAACSMIVGKKLENLHDALSNTRTDGIGALIREGAAAYLNSIVNKKFPFTTQQVKDCIVVAVISEGAASAQAGVFKKANDSHYKF
ncbi:hypothetical protein QYE76_021821 [Lolium multiflorum]|uniref:Uncharacterized protein n=1 Tax=Lolium multiflorum TaxID=4521 RepID=A0AAD8RBF6_LOLMU|nr:hypothetical protein QYE76_021821 [Lolium multiflorum]